MPLVVTCEEKKKSGNGSHTLLSPFPISLKILYKEDCSFIPSTSTHPSKQHTLPYNITFLMFQKLQQK